MNEQKKILPRDLIYDLYVVQGKSIRTLMKELNTSYRVVNRLLEEYGLIKEEAKPIEITRESLYEMYIVQNKRYEDIAKELNISCYKLDKLLSEFDIHKSKKQAHSLSVETNIAKHGSKEEYYKHITDSQRKTILNTGKSLDEYYSDVAKKMKATKEKKYGSSHWYNTDKMRETCIEKYGLSAPCMLPQARMHGNDSSPNREFEELLKTNEIEYEREFVLGNYSYDFKVGNNLIEINPTATHNSSYSPFSGRTPMEVRYHYKKALEASQRCYRCVHVWDWDDKNKIVALLKKRTKINARDCDIVEVSQLEASEYLNKYHLQGYAKDEIRLGLRYDNELVQIMTFGNPRYNKKFEYELIRLCSHCYVVGGAEKLFSYFIRTYSPKSVVSYCDKSKFRGDVYASLGFKYSGCSISKHWFNPRTGKHILDSLLRARGADQLLGLTSGKGTSNKELMLANGFVEIYDAGQARYEWVTSTTGE